MEVSDRDEEVGTEEVWRAWVQKGTRERRPAQPIKVIAATIISIIIILMALYLTIVR